jgi:predicted dehydrogenase
LQLRVQVTADETSPGTFDLYQWLTDDPDVARTAELALAHDDQPDTLGSLEEINVVVSNLTALAGLLVTVATWREARARGAETRVERPGVSLRIESTDPEAIRRLLQQLADADGPAESAEPNEPNEPGTPEPGPQEPPL